MDFSEPSREALGLALELAVRMEARLVLLYVHDWSHSAGTRPEVLEEVWAATERALASLKEETERKSGLQVSVATRFGEPAAQIVRFAHEGSCDLIVMASGRLPPGHGAPAGTITARVLREAPCPVLAIPSAADRAARQLARELQ